MPFVFCQTMLAFIAFHGLSPIFPWRLVVKSRTSRSDCVPSAARWEEVLETSSLSQAVNLTSVTASWTCRRSESRWMRCRRPIWEHLGTERLRHRGTNDSVSLRKCGGAARI
jgi:hypothetical protein